MKPYGGDVVTVAVQILGLRTAIERLERAVAQREDPVQAYLPLFEALDWLVAIDDRIGAIWVPDGKKLGDAWRERVDGGVSRTRSHGVRETWPGSNAQPGL